MLNKRQKSISPLNLIFSYHHKRGSVSSDSSEDGSRSSKELERRGSSDDGRIGKKSLNVSALSPSYYDEFTPTANLGALEIFSSDAPLLDKDPFASTPPASPRTPTSSPPSPGVPLIPFSPPVISPEVSSSPTYNNAPSTAPKTPTRKRPITPINMSHVSFTLSPPTAEAEKDMTRFFFPPVPPSPNPVAASRSPLSPVKPSLPSSPVRSRHQSLSQRRKVMPPQPSLDTLTAVELKKAPSQRKGRVGGELPLEPWNDYTIQPVCPVLQSSSRPKLGPYSYGGLATKEQEYSTTVMALRQVKSYVNIRKSATAPSHTRFNSLRKMGNWSDM
ncbi:hypothetical protein L218DRAFT_1000149 [Marasmius fiardii PR-910]|nr:hypothetical protein L218DRAFT_1000149 [Marasmius fiardii PR-910]